MTAPDVETRSSALDLLGLAARLRAAAEDAPTLSPYPAALAQIAETFRRSRKRTDRQMVDVFDVVGFELEALLSNVHLLRAVALDAARAIEISSGPIG